MSLDTQKGKGKATELEVALGGLGDDLEAKADNMQPNVALAWASQNLEKLAILSRERFMQSKVVAYADTIYAVVAEHLPLDVSEWPEWAAPLVEPRERAQASLAAGREEAAEHARRRTPPPETSPAPPTSRSHLHGQARFPWRVEVVITTRPKRKHPSDDTDNHGDDDADTPPAKRPKCDYCARKKSDCVLRNGQKRCDRCTKDKKGCRIDGESYGEWIGNAWNPRSGAAALSPGPIHTSRPRAAARLTRPVNSQAVAAWSGVSAHSSSAGASPSHAAPRRGELLEARRIRLRNIGEEIAWLRMRVEVVEGLIAWMTSEADILATSADMDEE